MCARWGSHTVYSQRILGGGGGGGGGDWATGGVHFFVDSQACELMPKINEVVWIALCCTSGNAPESIHQPWDSPYLF